jgi:glutamate-1-semialdehyde 2,1-aminomutase
MILGHRHPRVVAAIERALATGTTYGAPTEAESRLAELIVAAVPSIEKVRMVSSGTEAAMSAVRLARGFTGRDLIVKFAGNYHGHADSLLVSAGSAAATLGVPNSPGVTAGTARDTLVLEYNEPQQLEDLFRERGDSIAAVLMEPVVGNMGLVVPTAEFLAAVRDLTRRHAALFVCDEVMTGFRLALGGAQELLGIEPDLTTLGKIVGGGLPLGAYGGRADVMDHILPAGKVFQAGTLSGNPLAVAAGTATLEELRDRPPYEALERIGGRLEAGFRRSRRRRERLDRPCRQHDDDLLPEGERTGAGDRLADRVAERHRPLRRLLLGHDRPGHLHAVQPVRGSLLLVVPHRGRHRPHDRRRRRVPGV